MQAAYMISSNFGVPQMGLNQNPETSATKLKISCGLRNGPRKPMWRSSVLSTEAIQAVQSLKLANSPHKLNHVLRNRVSRLLKTDLLDTLFELQRQNQFELALMVFKQVREEVWFEPDVTLFNDMIQMFGKNKMIEMVEKLFSELKEEGFEPDTRTYTEMMGAYFKVNMIDKAMLYYELMKASGFIPDKLTFTILIRNLKNAGEEELVAKVKEECIDYIDSPATFLDKVGRTYPKRRSFNFV